MEIRQLQKVVGEEEMLALFPTQARPLEVPLHHLLVEAPLHHPLHNLHQDSRHRRPLARSHPLPQEGNSLIRSIQFSSVFRTRSPRQMTRMALLQPTNRLHRPELLNPLRRQPQWHPNPMPLRMCCRNLTAGRR